MGLWARQELGRALFGSKSWGSSWPGRDGSQGHEALVPEAGVSGSTTADVWLETWGTAAGSFGGLGLGERCRLRGQWLTKDVERGRGSEEIPGAARGAARPVSPELLSLCVLCLRKRNLSCLMEQTKM